MRARTTPTPMLSSRRAIGAGLQGASVAMVRREVFANVVGFFRSATPIASSKITVIFYGEFCVIVSKGVSRLGSSAYRRRPVS